MGLLERFKMWLMYHRIIPPPSMRGLKIGDRVKVVYPELGYKNKNGTITANEAPEILRWQTQFIQVTFDFSNRADGRKFVEYFTPDELEVIREDKK